jgi:putative endonuclease
VPRTRESLRLLGTATARRTLTGYRETDRVGIGRVVGTYRLTDLLPHFDHTVYQRPRSHTTVHYVYVLACADGSLYTGYTTDVERRVAEHNAGEGAKYTRGRTPVEPVHVETFESQSAAMSREYEIKQLSRRQKERLVGE